MMSGTTKNRSGIVILIGTHTNEKNYQYDLIAKHLADKLGYPIIVRPLKKYATHIAAIEDGADAAANADQKFRETLETLSNIQNPHSAAHRSMQEECRQNGFDLDLRNTIISSEDSIAGIPADLWDDFSKKLRKSKVNPALLKNVYDYTYDGLTYKMLVDYGQIKEAAGAYNFHELLRQVSADNKKYRDSGIVPLLDEVVFQWRRVTDPDNEHSKHHIKERTKLELYAPHGITEPLPRPTDDIDNPKHFQRMAGSTASAGEGNRKNFFDYLINHSFRRKVMENLLQSIQPVGFTARMFNKTARELTRRLQKPFVVQITQGATPRKVENHKGKTPERKIPKTFAEFSALLALEFSPTETGGTQNRRKTKAKIEKPTTPDVIVIPPYTPKNEQERVQMAMLLSSIMVAKQIDPRFHHAEIIMMNLRGCFNDFIRLSNTLTNEGLYGNHWRDIEREFGGHPFPHLRKTVAMNADRYVTVLSSKDAVALNEATQAYTHESLRGMARSPYQPESETSGSSNTDIPNNALTVVPLMSATTEERNRRKEASLLRKIALKQGYHILYGGMTKGPGNALLDLSTSNGTRNFIHSVTTELLFKTESDGTMPNGLASWFMYKTIEPRARHLIDHGDVFLVKDGGMGTLQEFALIMLAKIMEPEKYRNKAIIFVAPDRQYGSVPIMMNYVFSAEKAERMLSHHSTFVDDRLHVVSSVMQAKSLLKLYADEKNPPQSTTIAARPTKKTAKKIKQRQHKLVA